MKRLISISCIFALCLEMSSCQTIQQQIREKNAKPEEEQAKFDQLANDLFIEEVQSDSITLNYTLANPEKYGITNFKPTLGSYGVKASKEAMAKAENVNAQLDNIVYSVLTEEQKITYDVIKDCYKLDKEDEKYILYSEALGSTTGIQAQLPILFSEYNINDKEDLEDYLTLLTTVDDYFQQIEDFEKEKSQAGLFMTDETADGIISQCQDFIANPEENLLITIFEHRLNDIDWLTSSEKLAYSEQNKDAVTTDVIPAYQELIETLKSLKGTGVKDGGVGNLPDGKDYYVEMVQASTGSSKSIRQMKRSLSNTMQDAEKQMQEIGKRNSDILSEFQDIKYKLTDPDEILDYLTKAVEDDFPPLEKVNYTVKYVDKSLEDHVSPAFYLSPQFDNYEENSIYINGAANNDLSQIFPTLAHEGYPGHLLQTVYQDQHNSYPIRNLLNYKGYSEGWATYCENYSYSIAGLDNDLAQMAQAYNRYILCLYAEIDIGVNYDCWDKDDLSDYLKKHNIQNPEVTNKVFNIVVDDPGNYLNYVIGFIEFEELRDTAKSELRDQFNLKDFHTFILNTGESSFTILEDRMEDWLEEQKK